jgi:hypothetical protein
MRRKPSRPWGIFPNMPSVTPSGSRVTTLIVVHDAPRHLVDQLRRGPRSDLHVPLQPADLVGDLVTAQRSRTAPTADEMANGIRATGATRHRPVRRSGSTGSPLRGGFGAALAGGSSSAGARRPKFAILARRLARERPGAEPAVDRGATPCTTHEVPRLETGPVFHRDAGNLPAFHRQRRRRESAL